MYNHSILLVIQGSLPVQQHYSNGCTGNCQIQPPSGSCFGEGLFAHWLALIVTRTQKLKDSEPRQGIRLILAQQRETKRESNPVIL